MNRYSYGKYLREIKGLRKIDLNAQVFYYGSFVH